jgi:urease gamma subunit
VDGRTLTALPLSMANALAPLRENKGMALNGESAVPMASLPMDAVVTGQQVVTLQVEDQ